jgi:hypothetical protein
MQIHQFDVEISNTLTVIILQLWLETILLVFFGRVESGEIVVLW